MEMGATEIAIVMVGWTAICLVFGLVIGIFVCDYIDGR